MFDLRLAIKTIFVSLCALHCGGSQPAPSPAVALPPPPPAAAVPEGPSESGPPVVATFIDLTTVGAPLKARTCEQIVLSVARGAAEAAGEKLGEGDFLITTGEGPLTVKGRGLALAAAVRTDGCTPRAANQPAPPLGHTVVRANVAPELTWAGGTMHAHLDVEKELAGAYVGRLAGTAAVAEHMHDSSWEVLGAIEGQGTFTVDGKPKRLAARDVVAIPPKTKHSWAPDAGTTLVAIQFYWPSGPEERFRGLAAAK